MTVYKLIFLLCLTWLPYLAKASDLERLSIYTEISIQETAEKYKRSKVYLLDKGEISPLFYTDKEFQTWQRTTTFQDSIGTDSRPFVVTTSSHTPIPISITATLKGYEDSMKYLLDVKPKEMEVTKDNPATFIIYYTCDQLDAPHGIVTIEVNNSITFEYLKQCHSIPNNHFYHIISSCSLLVIAVLVLSIGVKQDQLSFLRHSREAELYEIHSLSLGQVGLIMLFASSVLLGFYIMIKYFDLIWLITIFFMTSISTLMIPFFMDVITSLAKGNLLSLCNLTFLNGYISVKLLVSLVCTFCLVGTWVVSRNWVANNIIGWVAVLVILRIVRLHKLMPGLLLLSALFLYDIFWVFFSPYIFRGESVMVVVATNVDLPVKLVFPGYSVFTNWALLGLGDLAIPGFFMSFVTRFGDYVGTSAYYFTNIVAYFLSIAICIWIISLGYGGQPALLYIVPALFLATFLVAAKRGEVTDLFEGVPSSYTISRQSVDLSDSSFEPESEMRTFRRATYE